MKYVIVYVTPDQTAKTVAMFLFQGYILIFGAPARLLSDLAANFMSNIISEMCKLLGVKKLHTTPYHPQTNGLVERSHQTIMHIIRKLGEDKKADWPGHHHLAEIVHAYNATRSAMMGYSPHYLMFGCRPRLPVIFYFPTLRSAEVLKRGTSTKCVDEYVATVWDHLKVTLQEAQAQSMAEAQRQKQYYDWKIGTIGLMPGNLVLVKADAFQGKRKIMDRWEDKPHEVVHQIMTDVPSYEVKDQQGNSHILHHNWLLLIAPEAGIPFAWVSKKYWTDVPAPPQSSLLPGGVTVRLHHKRMMVWDHPVTVRLHHKRMMVWWSPSIRLGILPCSG